MLDEFRLVIKEHWDALKRKPISATLRRSEIEDETLTPPLYKAALDVQTEHILASFAVWDYGEITIIVMDRQMGKEILVDEQTLNDPSELRNLLTNYFQQILQSQPLKKSSYE